MGDVRGIKRRSWIVYLSFIFVMLLLTLICAVTIKTKTIHYDPDDYETYPLYEDAGGIDQPYQSNVTLPNLTIGRLFISLLDSSFLTSHIYYLDMYLMNENGQSVWEYHDEPPAYIKERISITIYKGGDYYLLIECGNIRSLDLDIYYMNINGLFTIFSVCCCVPMFLIIGLVLAVLHIKKRN